MRIADIRYGLLGALASACGRVSTPTASPAHLGRNPHFSEAALQHIKDHNKVVPLYLYPSPFYPWVEASLTPRHQPTEPATPDAALSDDFNVTGYKDIYGLYSRVARQMKVSPSHVRKVDLGLHASKRVKAALIAERTKAAR